MTLLEVTAVDVTRDGKPCCQGLVQQVRIGRSPELTSVAAVVEMPSQNDEAFYATISGQFVDVAVDHCPCCREAYLRTVGDDAISNRLLRLGRLDPRD